MLELKLPKFSITFFFFILQLAIDTQVFAQITTQYKPLIQHATTFKSVDDINAYWVSEKLDGVRGYWNGKQLLTRQGNLIHSPVWFTQYWPNHAIDGELWLGRDTFQQTLSCVIKINIDETCWKKVRFMIFDLPDHGDIFTNRIKSMEALIIKSGSPYLVMVEQFQLKNTDQLDNTLSNIISKKGEGLMLHRGNAYYHVGRTANIMKLKEYQDAEAIVIEHIDGKGKYQGMLGALKVKTADGIVFKIGSGFSDAERLQPPAIGSIITYKYNGKTQLGIPRFARYFRVRKAV